MLTDIFNDGLTLKVLVPTNSKIKLSNVIYKAKQGISQHFIHGLKLRMTLRDPSFRDTTFWLCSSGHSGKERKIDKSGVTIVGKYTRHVEFNLKILLLKKARTTNLCTYTTNWLISTANCLLHRILSVFIESKIILTSFYPFFLEKGKCVSNFCGNFI